MRRLTFVIFTALLAGGGLAAAFAALPAFAQTAPDAAPVAAKADTLAPAASVAPAAKKAPKVFRAFGRERIDDYDWLRNDKDPEVIAYLNAENAYAAARLAKLKPLIERIDEEISDRDDTEQASPEFANNGYLYHRRIAKGARFPTVVRRSIRAKDSEQVVLDINQLAAGHKQYSLDNFIISPDNTLVAFAVDFTGARSYRLFTRNIVTGEVVDTGITDADSDLEFSADSKYLFYIRVAPNTVRSYQLWRHAVGTDRAQDKLVYEEKDRTFDLTLSKTKSGRYILLEIEQQRTSEVRYLPADQPEGEFRVLEPRRHGLKYEVDHLGGRFFIRTNLNAPDFRLVSAPEAAPQAANWTEILPERRGRFFARFELFDTFIATVDVHDAVRSVRVFRRPDMREIAVPRPADIGVMELDFAEDAPNKNPAATVLHLRFSAPALPYSAYDFDTATGQLSLRKKSPAWTWFDPTFYRTERIEAKAPDGETVPVTVIYRKDLLKPGGNPTFITAYGAYGDSDLPAFTDTWVSLIDRGFVFAIAHVRGGREKGQHWYDDGRVLNKKNSFTDFIAVTETLISRGLADRKRIFAHGASAGGLLVAAVANMRPDLYAGIVAEVPSVDVVTSMSDPNLPLTTLEYEEWGNPAIKQQFDYMLSYSPYDNVAAKRYPAMFVTAGLHDTQVKFHEPAKWVAKLRALKTDKREILFLTNMDAGHSGIAGRTTAIDENARIMAWVIAQSRLRRETAQTTN